MTGEVCSVVGMGRWGDTLSLYNEVGQFVAIVVLAWKMCGQEQADLLDHRAEGFALAFRVKK